MQLRHSPLQQDLDETVQGQSRGHAEYIRCRLISGGGRLRVLQSDDEALGVLSTRLYSLVRRLHASGCVFTELVIAYAAYKMASIDWKQIGTSARCPVELNVYSHRHVAEDTGKTYVIGVGLNCSYSISQPVTPVRVMLAFGLYIDHEALTPLSNNFMSSFPHRKFLNMLTSTYLLRLALAGMYLQLPGLDFRRLPYHNPQTLDLHDVMNISQDSESVVDEPDEDAQLDTTSKDLSSVLDHLHQPKLRELPVDERIITKLHRYAFLNRHLSIIKRSRSKIDHSYQRQAVDFAFRRETKNVPVESSLWRRHLSKFGIPFYQHVITAAKSDKPEDFRGGILADDMGLGKSLTMISVIVSSLDRALEYAVANTHGIQDLHRRIVPSKATLIVVPSVLLIDNWIAEIEKHVLPGTLAVHKYHGAEKAVNMFCLLQKDVVLTTYASVTTEFRRGVGLLNKIEWFRLILDEGK